MSHLATLWMGTLTRNVDEAGTDNRIELIVNENGLERLHHTFPDTAQEDQERGKANLYKVEVATKNIVPEALNDSSIRVGIKGDDAWHPQHMVIWGSRFSGGAVIPLAIETDLTVKLSTKASEGVSSIPLRLVSLGSGAMQINRLLMLMTTSTTRDAGTNSAIELEISTAAGLIVDFDVPDTPQDDQETGEANLYFVPVASSFTKNSLSGGSIRLRIKGDDAWRPTSFFLFGLDDAAGRPEFLVPLVHLRTWPFGQLSTDSSEGVASVSLPLA